jgi:RNA polymerase sigma-70 factor (ECF subfamily)
MLVRLRDPSDHEAWRDFTRRYGELLLGYCRSRGLQHCDAEDVRQVVLLQLSSALRGFAYSPTKGRFRSYLGATVRHAVDRFLARQNRGGGALSIDVVGEPADGQTAADPLWEQEWIDHHYRMALRTLRQTVEPRTLEVFDRLAAGEPAEAVAAACGMGVDAVYKTKQRVRDRLRATIAEQVREEESSDG